ncbi:hypothetical protein BVRB_6g146660 [Beta vulgaris subsp. vulgaris]|nr:hypothetical protein BVRB_6g146660 [Beta vulgaris subsp. vulgaris]
MKQSQQSFFSFLLSPFKRSEKKNNRHIRSQSSYNVAHTDDMNGRVENVMNRRNQLGMIGPNVEISVKDDLYKEEECGEEDVDDKAEVFIREKRKNFLFSKTLSMFVRK